MGTVNVTLYAKWTLNSYTITFDKNDAGTTGSMTPQTIVSGSTANLTACGFSKSGWSFAGWATTPSGAVAYTDQAPYTMGTANVTLYAKWTANSYTITFNINDAGATGSMSPQTIVSGSTANLTACGFSKPGWSFAGWATTPSGAVAYTNQAPYTMGTANVTLYAKWTANNYTITFDKNDAGATGSMSQQIIASGSTANLTACGFTKTGFSFAGWATTQSGTVAYIDQASYTMGTANVTLYAKWTGNPYTITFDKNDAGAGGSMSPQTIACGSTANLTACGYSKTGYTFHGWATASTGAVVYANQAPYTMGASNVTLYAKWVVMDADGNIYATIVIDGKTFMVENLKTTKYNDGSPITNEVDNARWSALASGAYCWYDNNSNTGNVYGALYNWYAVGSQKLAPIGWRVVSQYDYRELGRYCDPNWPGTPMDPDTTANALKEAGNTHWSSNNPSTNNRTGFTAFGGGSRYSGDGEFMALRSSGHWWSSDASSSTEAFEIQMTAMDPSMYEWSNDKKNGYSVRCVLIE
jgi:uncharacterized protein (TIGR02145 family)/uncharacterized repeat protein (TIGR02543 family)